MQGPGRVWTLWSATVAESIGEEGARYYFAKAGIRERDLDQTPHYYGVRTQWEFSEP